MARDPRKRQKELLKRRRKQKEVAKQRNRLSLFAPSPHTLVRRAREFPIYECKISKNWQKDTTELTQIVIARQQPNGNITFGVYLVDRACLGLKSTFCNADFAPAEYKLQIRSKVAYTTPLEDCPPELVHQMIYQAIDYAAQFGFKPDKDFKLSQMILEPRGHYPEKYSLKFGKDGKPLFIAGPYDNVPAILAKLEAKAGPGNYDYVVMMGEDVEDFFDDNELDDLPDE